ncbi:MAG: Os1348 family NHLP clan protein [Chloracidobacterium sp.]|nr:Os1348 family NHLP clan protein [Chloracidobacterium sp.]MDW8217498.1 Os1348 family NHLP clan protein [Acidobacteriota bacterium]
MSSPQFEAFLARLYADEAFRERFLAAPEAVAATFGLTPEERAALATLDLTGLELAARIFARKLDYKAEYQRRQSRLTRWRRRRRDWLAWLRRFGDLHRPPKT